MALRPAGSAQQLISWKTAPTLSAKTGDVGVPGQTTSGWHLTNLYIANPLGKQVTIARDASTPYPAGFSQGGTRNQVVNWNGSATPVERTEIRWIATQANPPHSVPIVGWVEALAPAVQLPTVPVNVVATEQSTTSVEVRWSAGSGGSEITAFRLYRATAEAGPWGDPIDSDATSPHTDSGLDPGTTYWYTVDAYDGTAYSSQAVADSAMTFPGVPDAPVSFGASGTGPTEITVTWIAASTQPSAVEFRLHSATSAGGSYSQVNGDLTGSSYVHTDLTPSTEYFYKLKAVDASNTESAFTAVFSTSTQAPAKPSVPLAFEVHPVTDTQIDGSWSASSGGVAPLKYNLYRQKVAGGPWDLFQPNLTTPSFSHTGIAPNKTLCYKVTAIDANAQESGESQVKCTATYLYEVPQAPVSVQVLPDATNPTTALRVTWTPSSQLPEPEKYRVYWATSSGGVYAPFATEPATPSYTDSSDLSPGEERFYKIKAINIVNEVETDSTDFSPIGSGTTNALPVPGTPTNVVATALDANTIRTTWDAGPGGTPTGYRIFRSSTGAAGSFTQIAGSGDRPASPTNYEDATLQPGDRRWYALKALDSATSYVSNLSLDDDAQTPVVETGDVYYVSATGSDANNGTSAATPKKSFTSVMALAQVGDTVKIMPGTYTTPLVTVRGGPITIEAYNATVPVISGAQSGDSSVVINHPFIDFGEGIEVRGNNTGTTSSWSTAKPTFGVSVNANDVTVRGRYRNIKNGFITKNAAATRLRMIDVDGDLCGTLNMRTSPPPQDKGEGAFMIDGSSGDAMLYRTRLARSGHNCAFFANSGKQRIDTCLMTNDWQSIWGTNKGNRLFEMKKGNNRSLLVDSVLHTGLDAIDAAGSTNFCKNENGNTLWLRSFLLNHTGGDGMVAIQSRSESGQARDQRYAHMTFWKSNGYLIKLYDESGTGGFSLPFLFTNCLFTNCTGDRVINIQYRSSRGKAWTELFFFEKCAFDSNYNIRITDLDASHSPINTTVNAAVSAYSANFAPNNNACFVVTPPIFVSTDLPASTDPVTALGQARANFLPQAAGLLNSGVWLTRVNGPVAGLNQITVDDGKWFYDSMGFTDATGMPIFIEGASAGARTVTNVNGNVLTLNTTVTCADNAKVWFGTDATPNIGAA